MLELVRAGSIPTTGSLVASPHLRKEHVSRGTLYPPPIFCRFRGWWSEDTPENEFEDSLFNLYAVQALAAGYSYTAIIDRSSSIKSNCGHAVSQGATRQWERATFWSIYLML